MSKFHEEFFNKGSPRHDKLVKQTIEKFGKIFENKIQASVFSDIMNEGEEYTITVCCPPNWCRHQGRIAWYGERSCEYCEYLNKELFDYKFFSMNRSLINHLRNGRLQHSQMSSKLRTTEVERICKNGNFIIGYADINFALEATLHYNIEIESDWLWSDFFKEEHVIEIITECKPDMESWGAALRQIKTYMTTFEPDRYNSVPKDLWHVYGLISTYSDLPDSTIELLRGENIFTISFEEKTGELK